MIVALVCTAANAAPAPVNDQAAAFEVKKVKGGALVQQPMTGEWTKVFQGMKIPQDSLLQVPPRASITLVAVGSLGRTGLPVSSSTVSINKSMIIRLSLESFRKIQMDSKLIASLPDANSLKIMQKHLSAFDAMVDAWRQDATMLAGKEWIDDDIFKQLADVTSGNMEKDAVSVTGRIGKIDLMTPKDMLKIFPRELPFELNMNWSIVDAAGESPSEFKVYLWKKGQARQVFARVKGERFVANIVEDGKYYIQIESTDGRYKSELQWVEIKGRSQLPRAIDDQVAPLDAITKEGNEAVAKVAINRAKLLNPPAELRLHSSHGWPLMQFQWIRPKIGISRCDYKFQVKDSQNKLVYSLNTNQEIATWQPPANVTGQLSWFIETISCDSVTGTPTKISAKSHARRFFLEPAAKIGVVMAPFDKATKPGYVYLDL
jgi:hypothetical protein